MDDDGSFPEELRRLLDKRAIEEVLVRYARAIDRCDLEQLRSVYHPDATDDHGWFRGSGWGFADWCIDTLLATPQVTTHLLGNVLIDLRGDEATCESHYAATHVYPAEGGSLLYEYHGRYLDKFERRNGSWAILDRLTIYDWDEKRIIRRVSAVRSDVFVKGVRGPDDRTYPMSSW